MTLTDAAERRTQREPPGSFTKAALQQALRLVEVLLASLAHGRRQDAGRWLGQNGAAS